MPLPKSMITRRLFVPVLVIATIILGVAGFGQPAANNAYTIGTPTTGSQGIGRTTAEIMTDQAARGPRKQTFVKREFVIPGRANRPQNPASRFDSQYPRGTANNSATSSVGTIAGPNF